MPQASDSLRKKWGSMENAFKQLTGNFVNVNGIIFPVRGYKPTKKDLSAIDYLFYEWDFGYNPGEGENERTSS